MRMRPYSGKSEVILDCTRKELTDGMVQLGVGMHGP